MFTCVVCVVFTYKSKKFMEKIMVRILSSYFPCYLEKSGKLIIHGKRVICAILASFSKKLLVYKIEGPKTFGD